ncbi:MAG: NAD(P)H-dependent oxidoreductase [Bacteroidetes bacterium]|nr:NAD(P)H-dependent oxidoreductase [Bacteroidota bacterium]
MITIICGTNRRNAVSKKLAQCYSHIMTEKGVGNKLLLLEDIPVDFISPDMYDDKSESFEKIESEYMTPAEKFIFVLPEYNGSIPGFLKLFIDACSVKSVFWGKKACLVGVAAGQAGNIRGLDHFTSILNHLKVNVYHNKPKISKVLDAIDDKGHLTDQSYWEQLNKQLDGFLQF